MKEPKGKQSKMKRSKMQRYTNLYKIITGLIITFVLAFVGLKISIQVSGSAIGREELLIKGQHLHSLAVLAGDPDTLLVGAHGGLFKSTDEGKTWEVVPGEATKTDVMGLYVHQRSDQVIYASGHDIGIMKSLDGGQRWISLVKGLPEHPDVHAMTSNPHNPQEVYIWVVGVGLFKSSNGGERWSLISPGLAKINVWSLAVHPEKSETLYAGTSAGFLVTRNGGFSWQPVRERSPEKPLFSLLIDPENPKVILGGTQQGMLKTVDEGLSWSPVEGVREDILALARHPVESRRVYALTARGNILKSQDGGNTWQ
ncbi:MAG TPA: hypothetical protein VNM22_15930 [Candidatus Limnocylindrales bacterium]|nr:hypothetical protein [Candidatus Limnocylindrales bacterium]